MKVNEAIAQANKLQPNALDDELKAKWLHELDCDIAEMMELSNPALVWPTEDAELLMPAPHDNIYPLYLVSQIDFYNKETEEYANDKTIFNSAYDDARAWWRRHNRPPYAGNWRTM